MFQETVRSFLIHFALIALVATVLFAPAVLTGMPIGHSYYPNHAWTLSFAEALSWSNPYPRWLPGTWAGSGSPDFYFYPPLFFYVAALAQNTCCAHPDQAIAITGWLFHVASGIGVWMLARSLGLGSLGRLAAAIAILLLPYHLNVFFARSALGEVALFAALGFLLSGFSDMLARGRGGVRIVLGSAAIILSHILSVPLAAMGCFAIVFAYRKELELRRVLAAAALGCLGALTTAIYWLPALLLRDTVASDILLLMPWANNLLLWGNIVSRKFLPEVYLPALALTPCALAACWIWRKEAGRAATFSAVTLAAAWFMMTPISKALWLHTPLPILQFPWRFMVVVDFGFALAAGFAAEQLRRNWSGLAAVKRRVLRAGAVVLVVIVGVGQPAWYASNADAVPADRAIQMRIAVLEWLSWNGRPLGFGYPGRMVDMDLSPPLDRDAAVSTDTVGAAVELISEEPREIVFRVDAESDAVVLLRRGFWEFWVLERLDDGMTVSLDATDPHPLITATLPAGEGTWRLRLEMPWAEKLGIAVSAAAIVAVLVTLLLVGREALVGRRRS
ncbi:MAG: hypothetical protein AAGE90_03150 [Pseudomonadota bacterium]